MSTGTWHAARNKNGKIVLQIESETGSKVTVPNASRASNEQALLDCNGKKVEYKTGEGGALVSATCGNKLLFGSVGPNSNSTQAVDQSQQQAPSSKGNGTQLQTISQQRAKHALESIQNSEGLNEGKLKSYIVGMPAMILMSGFGQSCAFYVSKAELKKEESKRKDEHKAYERVIEILWSWLKEHVDAFRKDSDLMTEITKVTAKDYQLAETESLEYLNWLKKFAKAYLKDEKPQEDE